MNKTLKIIVTIIGAINVIFNIFIPIALSLMLIKVYNLQGINYAVLLIIGLLSSIYRAIDIADIETVEYLLNKITEDGRKPRKSK